MNKNNLRDKFMSKRENLKNKIIVDKSKRIISNFLMTDFYKNNNKIFIYVSYKNEVITHDLIKKMLKDKKEVYVPNPNPETKQMEAVLIKRFDDLTEGTYGILEPTNSSFKLEPYFLDLIIVPGLVFSHKGFRIGYGGGFYDRFLARAETKKSGPLKISFVYKEFIIDEIPIDQYDLPVDYIITEEKIINCKNFRGI